jgi:hypothetical protein
MLHTALQEFTTPGAAYRGKPFWAWNGKLEPDELRRQVRAMHRMGLGGFFMHSRVGLDTAYLSDDWFTCIDACIDEAKTLGMEAWLYDEDRWPSGAAGGLVTKKPKHRMRSLMLQTLDDPKALAWKGTLAAFAATIDGDRATGVRPLAKGQKVALAPGEVVLRCYVEVQPSSPWYNDAAYLDTLSHEAVQAFIESTHEVYRKRTGAHFGRTVPGMFTDEPNHGHKLAADNNTGAPRGIPWTGALPRTFKKRYGYSLLPHLVELFFDVDGQAVTPARYHYHDCVTHLFVDAFARQVGAWCKKHDLAFTGHVLEEDTLSHQTNVVGSPMRFYEYMQAPGMDLLTEHWRVFDTAKQVTSAARQFGRTWRLTETYGCTGWDFSFAGHKALGDWQAALGINLRCQHLSWYTMRGEAKRDYPAAIFYQSPWWELYPKVEDYFARIHAVMTHGTEVRDLLVIHPVESMWLRVKSGWLQHPDTHAYDRMLSDLSDTLLAGHVDFDYGDEEILSRHAKVRRGKDGPELHVGQAVYRTVLVPPLTTMRATTLALLKRFQHAGGTVVFAGDPPAYVDARPSDAPARFAQHCPAAPAKGAGLTAAVEGARRLRIADADGAEILAALYLLREDAEAFYLFVCNTGEDIAADTRGVQNQDLVRNRTLAYPAVTITGFPGCVGAPLALDPDSGAVTAADAAQVDGGWVIRTSLPVLGSRLFVVPKAAGVEAPPAAPALCDVREEPLAADRWPIRLSEHNVLVLDRPRFRLNDGPWQEPLEILELDRAVRRAMGIAPRSGYMVQPWARKQPRRPKTIPVELGYAFTVDAVPSGDLCVALEAPEGFRITLNGHPVSTDAECGWWVDRSLRKVPLDAALLRVGDNELRLAIDYPETHAGLEIVYLLGAFGSAVRDETAVALTPAPAALALGDWCDQGLAFYAGSVLYTQTIEPALAEGERLFVRVPDYRGVGVRVLVNGAPAGLIAWEPNEVEITASVADGPVELGIEVIGHRRNSHGPFHINEKWPWWTGPGEFQNLGARWYDGYQRVPCGLMAPPALVVKR